MHSQAEQIRSAVADRYSHIGETPSAEDSIPRGRAWAGKLGYPASLLDSAPSVALESFTGIGAFLGAEIVLTDGRPPAELDLEGWFR